MENNCRNRNHNSVIWLAPIIVQYGNVDKARFNNRQKSDMRYLVPIVTSVETPVMSKQKINYFNWNLLTSIVNVYAIHTWACRMQVRQYVNLFSQRPGTFLYILNKKKSLNTWTLWTSNFIIYYTDDLYCTLNQQQYVACYASVYTLWLRCAWVIENVTAVVNIEKSFTSVNSSTPRYYTVPFGFRNRLKYLFWPHRLQSTSNDFASFAVFSNECGRYNQNTFKLLFYTWLVRSS